MVIKLFYCFPLFGASRVWILVHSAKTLVMVNHPISSTLTHAHFTDTKREGISHMIQEQLRHKILRDVIMTMQVFLNFCEI